MESVYSVEGANTIATNKFDAKNNLEDDDEDNFTLSIKSTQSHLENMSVNNFHNAQEEMQNSDEQPSQEHHTIAFNPTTVEAHQINLITNTVKGLDINPEEGMGVRALNAEGTEKDTEFGKDQTVSLTTSRLMQLTTPMLPQLKATRPWPS